MIINFNENNKILHSDKILFYLYGFASYTDETIINYIDKYFIDICINKELIESDEYKLSHNFVDFLKTKWFIKNRIISFDTLSTTTYIYVEKNKNKYINCNYLLSDLEKILIKDNAKNSNNNIILIKEYINYLKQYSIEILQNSIEKLQNYNLFYYLNNNDEFNKFKENLIKLNKMYSFLYKEFMLEIKCGKFTQLEVFDIYKEYDLFQPDIYQSILNEFNVNNTNYKVKYNSHNKDHTTFYNVIFEIEKVKNFTN